MAKCICYIRVSTEEQRGALAQQEATVEHYAKYVLSKYPDITEVLPVFREAASAYKIEFCKRPVGKYICSILERGDLLVASRLDRTFRIGRDFCNQMHAWEEQGVNVFFADLGIDMQSSAGKMLATIMAATAEQFSSSLSERQILGWRHRHLREHLHDNKYKIWLKPAEVPSGRDTSVLDKKAISYIRYVMWRRRYSFKKNGVADSWNQCCDDLERARVTHGDIPEYRPEHKRGQWNCVAVWHHVRRIRTSELAAVRTSWCCVAIRTGLDPFKLESRTKAGGQVGQKKPMRQRESLYQSAVSKAIIKPNSKPPKRWCRAFDQCVVCSTTDWPHKASGICKQCYDTDAGKVWREKKTTV